MSVQSNDRPLVVSAAGEPLNAFGLPEGVTALCREVVDSDGIIVPPSELTRRLRAGHDLERLGAPSAALLIDGDQVTVAADHVGFRHVYGGSHAGVAAIGTSARDVAAQFKAGLDYEALAVQRMVGHHLNEDTPFLGVKKLAADHFFRMSNGRLSSVAYPAVEKLAFSKDLVRAHADRMREIVCGFLDQHENVVLELSGGMDSRMILAAIPRARRAEVTSFTIAHSGSNDGPVARDLAARYGMAHIEADLDSVAEFSPAQAYEMAYAAAVKQDGMGAPLSAAVFDFLERPVATQPRFSGHGGEICRAHYYVLQPNAPKQTPALVDRYFNMWFANNYGVPDAYLATDFAVESRETGYKRMRETFAAYEGDWMTAINYFFLRERLHRWGGITITNSCDERVILNPHLDRQVLAIMLSVPHRRQWSSQQAVDVVAALEPELAELPLASGLRPVTLRRPSFVTHLIGETQVHKFAKRAGRKVLRHRRGIRRYAAGAPTLAALVVEHWRANPSLVDSVAASGLFKTEWLEQLIAGEAAPEAASVDFILNLTVLLEAV